MNVPGLMGLLYEREVEMSDEPSQTPDDGQSFEKIVTRLESIAHRLEQGDTKLEEALSLFEEGVKLSQEGTRRLDEAEHRLETLLGDGTTESFASDGA